jgi:chemotaxis receptor (MCP) glutamine deamidase CheD
MSTRITIAQVRIDQSPAILKAYGLGSCVAVALYDPEARIGGLGHLLLPNRPERNALATCRTNHELAANPPVWPIFQLLFDQ